MAFIALADEEVDAKSPLDDALFQKVQEDLDDLNSRVITAGNSPFVWEVNGPLSVIRGFKRSIAFGLVNKEFTPTVCRVMLKKSGTSGTLAIDLRKHTRPNTPIIEISHQYTAATSSIARQGTQFNTQSIARATPQISTQSITAAKSALNIQSIIRVQGTNRWRYNLNAAPDSDWLVGKSVIFSSCSNAANDGTFVIKEVNQSGFPSLVVENASGVAQTGVSGSAALQLYSYNFTNPVDSQFSAGELATFASHTSGANDGALQLYKVNQGGNNVWVFNATGVVQAGVAGTLDVLRWTVTALSALSTTDWVVGERALLAGHTSGANDGQSTITGVNVGGNNLVIYNPAGVAQGGVAGTVDTLRWKYNMPSNPTSDVSAGDTIYFSGHTNAANDGSFTVKEVTSGAIIVYNTAGVAQASTPGNAYTTRKLIKFSSDQSAVYTTDSFIEMFGTVSGYYTAAGTRAPFRVVQVNRGGGAAYNVVIDVADVVPAAPAQSSPAGHVAVEMKSIFGTTPEIAASLVSVLPDENLAATTTDLLAVAIPAQTPIMLYITEMHAGDPQDLTVLMA